MVGNMSARGTQGKTGFELHKRSQRRARARKYTVTKVSCLSFEVSLRNPKRHTSAKVVDLMLVPRYHLETLHLVSQRWSDGSCHMAPRHLPMGVRDTSDFVTVAHRLASVS